MNKSILPSVIHCQNFLDKTHVFKYSPTCIRRHPRDNPDVLIMTGACLIQVSFNKFAFLGELKSCLLNTGCLLNGGGHYDRVYCI